MCWDSLIEIFIGHRKQNILVSSWPLQDCGIYSDELPRWHGDTAGTKMFPPIPRVIFIKA
jgi:hypothetical protein